MKVKFIVHEAEEGGYWAEVPALPGCATQGERMDELLANLREAIEAASVEAVARIKRSEMRECVRVPDCALLHPGYACSDRRVGKAQRAHLRALDASRCARFA